MLDGGVQPVRQVRRKESEGDPGVPDRNLLLGTRETDPTAQSDAREDHQEPCMLTAVWVVVEEARPALETEFIGPQGGVPVCRSSIWLKAGPTG